MWSLGNTLISKKKGPRAWELPVVALEALETTWKQAHSDKAH